MTGKVRTDGGEIAILSGIAGFFLLLNRWGQASPKDVHAWTVDAAILSLVGGGVLFGGLLFAGHWAARRQAVVTPWAYAGAGALAALAAFFAFGGVRSVELAQAQGVVTIALGLPPLIGAGLGLVYRRMAGLEQDAPPADPAEIEAALVAARSHAVAAAPAGVPVSNTPSAPTVGVAVSNAPYAPAAHVTAHSEPALIEAGGQLHFAGPLQVRSSFALLAASGGAVGGLLAAIGVAFAIAGGIASGDPGQLGSAFKTGFGMSLLMIMFFGASLIVPTFLGHKLAQKLGIVSAGGYAGIGFVACFVAGFLFLPFFIAAPFTAVSMALYRRWAGIEPVPLPGDIVAVDRRALVAENHPARRYRRVVGA
jgi:hypothetical protein